jgi:ATP-dependent DNA helicase 2 subunit 1
MSLLPQSISITRIEELLDQMRIKEIPKRTLFRIPFHLAEEFTIGVKGYVLLCEYHGINLYYTPQIRACY